MRNKHEFETMFPGVPGEQGVPKFIFLGFCAEAPASVIVLLMHFVPMIKIQCYEELVSRDSPKSSLLVGHFHNVGEAPPRPFVTPHNHIGVILAIGW